MRAGARRREGGSRTTTPPRGRQGATRRGRPDRRWQPLCVQLSVCVQDGLLPQRRRGILLWRPAPRPGVPRPSQSHPGSPARGQTDCAACAAGNDLRQKRTPPSRKEAAARVGRTGRASARARFLSRRIAPEPRRRAAGPTHPPAAAARSCALPCAQESTEGARIPGRAGRCGCWARRWAGPTFTSRSSADRAGAATPSRGSRSPARRGCTLMCAPVRSGEH